MNTFPAEMMWLWPGLGTLAASAAGSFGIAQPQPVRERWVGSLLALAITLVAAAITVRWLRLGHGPFFNMFEILMSSVFSLGTIYSIAFWRMRAIRPTAPIVLALLLVMSLWLVMVPPADTHFVPTYDTAVLWFHLLFGKLFLGCTVIADGMAGAILLRARWARMFKQLPADGALERLAWHFMRFALVFETLMLIAGAVWAQDAWGRYWAWDPLETWAFVTWLTLAGAMHARASFSLSARRSAILILLVFALAFLTFFGVPFVSVAPHKGAV